MKSTSQMVVEGAPEFAKALDQVDATFTGVPPHMKAVALTALYALFLSWAEHIRPEIGAHINVTISPLMRKIWRNAMGDMETPQ